jgi:hypothetical protein
VNIVAALVRGWTGATSGTSMAPKLLLFPRAFFVLDTSHVLWRLCLRQSRCVRVLLFAIGLMWPLQGNAQDGEILPDAPSPVDVSETANLPLSAYYDHQQDSQINAMAVLQPPVQNHDFAFLPNSAPEANAYQPAAFDSTPAFTLISHHCCAV